jgi:hypothetical protein
MHHIVSYFSIMKRGKSQKHEMEFPFIGAGHAQYFEWCTVYVKFCSVPTLTQKRKIQQVQPKPIDISADDFHHNILVASTGQYVNREIEKYYGIKGKKKVRYSKYECSEEAGLAFEEALVTWLREVNGIASIQFVFRPEDGEAGGTALSEWHHNSLKAVPRLAAEWISEPLIDFSASELFEFMVSGVLRYAPEHVSAELEKHCMPKLWLTRMLTKGDINLLIAGVVTMKDRFDPVTFLIPILTNYLQSNTRDDKVIEAVMSEMIAHPNFVTSLFKQNTLFNFYILLALIREHKGELLARINEEVSKIDAQAIPGIVHPIYIETMRSLLPSSGWVEALSIFDFLFDLLIKTSTEHYDLSFYANAMWLLQEKNTQIPMQAETAKKFVSASENAGKKNPAVFYNAACLFVDMDDSSGALVYLEKAMNAGIKGDELKALKQAVTESDTFLNVRALPQYERFARKLL